MKRIVKVLLAAVVDRLPERYRRQLFWELAKKLAVSMIEIPGRQGFMRGYLRDQVFRDYVRTGGWAENISELARAGFRRHSSGTFLDVGANIGLTLVPVARDPKISCLAFEPDPANFDLLRANVASNCLLGDTRLFNVAALDAEGTVTLELSPENFGDHRVRTLEPRASSEVFRENERRTISVKAQPLDRLVDIDGMRRPLIIKVDTQGAEQHVYSGGRRTFAAADMLILEFWPYGIQRMGGDTELLLRWLEDDFEWGCFLRSRALPTPDEFIEIRQLTAELRTLAKRKEIAFGDINAHDLAFMKDRFFLIR
jgi:FkbM family methyltransferase